MCGMTGQRSKTKKLKHKRANLKQKEKIGARILKSRVEELENCILSKQGTSVCVSPANAMEVTNSAALGDSELFQRKSTILPARLPSTSAATADINGGLNTPSLTKKIPYMPPTLMNTTSLNVIPASKLPFSTMPIPPVGGIPVLPSLPITGAGSAYTSSGNSNFQSINKPISSQILKGNMNSGVSNNHPISPGQASSTNNIGFENNDARQTRESTIESTRQSVPVATTGAPYSYQLAIQYPFSRHTSNQTFRDREGITNQSNSNNLIYNESADSGIDGDKNLALERFRDERDFHHEMGGGEVNTRRPKRLLSMNRKRTDVDNGCLGSNEQLIENGNRTQNSELINMSMSDTSLATFTLE